MNKRTIYYTSAVAAPLLALGLVAAPVFAQDANGMNAARPELSDEQKATLEQVRELHKQGKRDEAHALLESAGFPMRPMMMARHNRKDVRKDMRERHEAIRSAVQSGDYAAFQELTKDAPFASEMAEAVFKTLVEASKLREAGDVQGAKTLIDESGIKRPHPVKRLRSQMRTMRSAQ